MIYGYIRVSCDKLPVPVITQHLSKHSHSGGFAFVRVDLHLFGRICNPAALSESICNALLAD